MTDENGEEPVVDLSTIDLSERLERSIFAFRGYNVSNLGRTPELLARREYGPTIERFLSEGSQIAADLLGRPVDLVDRVRERRETTLDVYGEAVALVICTELAQLELLEQYHGIRYAQAPLAAGYSLGELAALVAGDVFPLESVLKPLLELAPDTKELAADVRMGVLFSRGPEIDVDAVTRHCLRITNAGNGVIAISTILSPNTVLLMGQSDTVAEFKKTMHDALLNPVHLRLNQHSWPPIHTPISRQRQISDRAAVILDTVAGGFTAPTVRILSCVTGATEDYNDFNSRDILIRWIERPQRLWDVIERMFNEGVETVIHVGPEPNIIPATLKRLSNNVRAQLSGDSISSFGLRAISRIVRRHRPWLSGLLSRDAALLRAPFIDQINLEDWLLARPV